MMYTFELRPWLLVSDKMETVGGLYCTGSTLPHVSVKDGCERTSAGSGPQMVRILPKDAGEGVE